MKRLHCEMCGIDASAKWEWLWYGKELALPGGGEGTVRGKHLWLCPDCAADLGSDRARNAFLKRSLARQVDE